MIIIGEKEVSESVVSVREHGGKDHGAMSLDNFIRLVESTIENEVQEFKT
jgi:threonyl-tRNA synthetase